MAPAPVVSTVPVGMVMLCRPLLVKMTVPVAFALPCWVEPVAVPVPGTLISWVRSCDATELGNLLGVLVEATSLNGARLRDFEGTVIMTVAVVP